MSIEKLREEILRDTEKTVTEILSKAREEAEKIRKNAEEQAKLNIESRKQEILKKFSERERAEVALARLEGKKALLEVETKLLNEAISRAREKLANYQRDNNYLKIMINLALEALDNIGSDHVVILVNKNDISFLKENWKNFTSELMSKHPNIKIELGKDPIRIMGGLIVTSVDGVKIFNNSFDARLNRIISEERGKLSSILLGEV